MARILLVEDNEISREILARRLRRLGYEILEAASGEEAVCAAKAQIPGLILMDMTLPGIDGWEAARELRRRPETASIPVIALTAHTLPADRERALAAGCDEYEPKPVELPNLLRKIETLLARQSN
ncbi:MAG: response regulator [Acidobacteriia bacterium]|nr:response regulator [Terriglobia bacterium]